MTRVSSHIRLPRKSLRRQCAHTTMVLYSSVRNIKMKRRIITITGNIASGKTSTALFVAQELGYQHFYPGRLFREEAERRGISFRDLQELMKTDATIDQEIDARLKDVLDTKQDIIAEGRVAPYFCPDAFKVFLQIDETIALQRLMKDFDNTDRKTERVSSAQEALENMKHRLESERQRYKQLYNIENHMDPRVNDLVLDTGVESQPSIVQKIIEAYTAWLEE